MFTASIAGQKTLLSLPCAAYNFSKAGLLQLKSNLAAEWAQYGIRVNSISPGFMDTPMAKGASELRKLWEAQTPMGRIGDPSELAGVIVLFCSPAGRYITGVDILVDGQSPLRFPVDCDLMINEDVFQVDFMYNRDPEFFQFSEVANQFPRYIRLYSA